jgi:hypothetical protein
MEIVSINQTILSAGIFGWVGDILGEQSIAAIGAILMFYLGVIIKREIVPLLKVKRNREIAAHILVIADDVTDYFRLKFPNAHWSIWLDKAVDKIIDITGSNRQVANRVARASVARKENFNSVKK